MNREAAIYEFMRSFGIPAYAETGVPDQAEMPYVTYSLIIGSYDNPVSMAVNVWYRTDSEAIINAKVRDIERALCNGGAAIHYETDGNTRMVWATKGSPWAQAVQDEDNSVKRRYLNIDLQFMEL